MIRHDTESGYYLVRYEDEDQEECDEKELADIAVLQNKEQSPVPRPDLSLTVRETLCLFKLHGLAKDCYQKIVGFKAVDKIRVADFFLFMSERQRVWERRNRGDQEPWSASPVFQRYSWCNNYRELDRGTQFFRATVLEMLDDNCDANLREWTRKVLFASYVYRQVNRLESFVETGFPDEFKLAKYFNKVKKLKERGERFFSAAHQTTNFSKFEQFLKQATAKNSKMLEKVCDAISNAEGSKDCIEALQKLPGVGTFFAWQILCDLQESRCVHFEDGYSLLGPGAKCECK